MMNVIRKILLTMCLLTLAIVLRAQDVALKTNALYWATTTPNIGVEASLGKKQTIQLFYGFNPWKFSSGTSTRHWVVQPEWRYWFCEAFNGWFVGVHAMGGQFNIANIKDISLPVFDEADRRRYEGWFAGGGITAGYQWVLSKHFNVEASLGVGYNYVSYDKYVCGNCGRLLESKDDNYLGVTKAALSAIYIFSLLSNKSWLIAL